MLKCISSGRRLGEPSSIHETKNRAMSKPHRVGGPKSLTESFYCPDDHPEHPYNMRLNGPHSERTRDEREDGPASQSGSHDEEV